MSTRTIAFISSFPPRQCGIARFTQDLVNSVEDAAGREAEAMVIAMNGRDQLKYGPPVKLELSMHSKEDYIQAADHLNFSNVNTVCLQHEFGLFGGKPEEGEYINLFLERLKAPLVTTFHTTLLEPSDGQQSVVRRIGDCSRKVITMSQRGAQMLREVYDISEEKITVIPHGIPDLPQAETWSYKRKLGLEGHTTILTFGLLSRNKGIEVGLKALSQIVKEVPNVRYIVLGATHPNIIRSEGQDYRLSLQRLAKDLDVQQHVVFHNEFVEDKKLHEFLCAADFYVTPYLSEKQIVSGTLAYALGTGRAVISTPYWYAQELLADGHGILVPFGDSQAIAENILGLIRDPREHIALCERAYNKGRQMTWPVIGRAYWDLFSTVEVPEYMPSVLPVGTAREELGSGRLPELKLDHLFRMTDDTGLLQHALRNSKKLGR